MQDKCMNDYYSVITLSPATIKISRADKTHADVSASECVLCHLLSTRWRHYFLSWTPELFRF